nr:uncharacterized protein LOC103447699 isoform X2 [Malus domestica]
MSKRKLPSDDHSPPSFSPRSSDTMPCSSAMELLTQEHHPSLGRSMFFKRSRHHYAHQYSRRNSGNLANPSTSRGKGVPLRDDKLSYKLATQSSSEARRHSETKEKPFLRPARIRSGFLTTDAVSPDPGKMIVWSRKQVLKIDTTPTVRCVRDYCPRLKIQESRDSENSIWDFVLETFEA